MLSEWRRLPVHWARLAAAGPRLLCDHAPRRGRAVLIPGWRCPEESLELMRQYLRWLGHDARHWGRGTNRGRVEEDARVVAASLSEPVTLVGWSLGGVVAREVAREFPDKVRSVVTFGTPVTGPGHTIAAASYGPAACTGIAERIAARDRAHPIRTRVDIIFSRRDRVVSWPASIDRVSPNAVHHEVTASHAGLCLDPDVWNIVSRVVAPRAD